MLQLAGVEMAPGSLHEWLRLAHAAASFLIGADYSVPDAGSQPSHSSPSGGIHPSPQPVQLSGLDQGSPAVPLTHSQPDLQTADRCVDGATSLARSSVTSWHVLTTASATKRPVSAMAIKRWIMVQKALVEEGRLTHAQLRYMAVLGALIPSLTWACRRFNSVRLHLAIACIHKLQL